MSFSKRSTKGRDDSDLYLECKAAFLTEFDDIDDKIRSRNQLISLLQLTGRNPTRGALSKHWTSTTDSLTFKTFVDICSKEPVTKPDDLMNAFKKIDINGDGYISLDELCRIMNKKGENLSRDEVRKMIDEVDDNKDGRLDYREHCLREGKLYYRQFTNMVMKTTEESKKMSKKVMERKERRKKRGELSVTDTSKRRGSASSQRSQTSKQEDIQQNSARSVGEEIDPDDDQDIISTGPTPRISLSSRTGSPKTDTPKSAKNGLSKQIKEDKDDNDIGSQSSLRSDDMPRPSPRVRNSKVKSPSSSLRGKEKLPDPRVLQDWYHCTSKGCFFYEEDEIVSHVYSLKLLDDSTVYLCAEPDTDLKCLSNNFGSEPVDTALYVFDSRGSVVAFTEQRDIKGTYGVKLDLAAGVYQILPYTTGCRFKQRKEMPSQLKEAKLVKKDKEDKIRITSAFREALKNIFVLCDLDSNGTMSKEEFNWFNVRTSGEELGDDEWVVVEEKTTLQNGEITVEGFIELNELEAEDAEGDVEDLWITLTSMGMNKALIMDEACPYKLDVYVKEVGRKKPALTVTGIESLEKREFVTEICQYVIDKAGEPTSIRRMKDLYLYTMKNDYRATIVIDNRSRSTVRLQIDCSKSRNVISNREGLDHTFEIDPQQTAIAHHLMPRSELSDWNVTSVETIHK